MSLLLRFERRIEALVEGLFTPWARDRVHPVEIGRRVLREMEGGAVAGLRGALLPNEYRVYLNPKDFDPYQSFAPVLVGELAGMLRDRAAELGARPAGPVRVTVEPRDAIASGEIYVEARLAPAAEPPAAAEPRVHAGGPPAGGLAGHDEIKAGGPPAGGLPADSWACGAGQRCAGHHEIEAGHDEIKGTGVAPVPASDTRIYRQAQPAGARLRVLAGPAGTAGREFLLDRPVLTIGRRADQDIVIDDPSVSRAHARIHIAAGEAAVEDVGSTNGTALNGRPIGNGPVPVRDGDRIQIGQALLQYRSGS